MSAICTACHAPNGLHTADCHRAYRAAYDKAALDAARLCEQKADSSPTHSASQIALECAQAVLSLTGRADG